MGKGLGIHAEGVHIAFTAGTGVLGFLDLVAHLVRKNLGLLTMNDDLSINMKKFRLILYVAFPTKEDIIGFELCKGLKDINQALNKHNFEYNVRVSNQNEKLSKWDMYFIDDVLNPYKSKISKIWVCGPPKMNEDFDKALSKLALKYELKQTQIEIM